eukprot:m51a1_g8423 hypothetical protein (675) ;mRNA; r:327431-329455
MKQDSVLVPQPRRIAAGPSAWELPPIVTVSTTGPTGPSALDVLCRGLELLTSGAVRCEQHRSNSDAAADVELVCTSTGDTPPSLWDQSESYAVDVDERGHVCASSGSPVGLVWAAQTLLRLLERSDDGKWALPCPASVEDAPAHPWRGLLVDPCRHWLPLGLIERTVDAMSACKLNVLHLHLTDDQAWRLQVPGLPLLHQRGAPDGLSYSPDELRGLVAYCAARGVRVVPEVDMPGHCCALLEAFPQLAAPRRSNARPAGLQQRFGVFSMALDVARRPNECWGVVGRVLAHVRDVFGDECVHLGADETRLASSPSALAGACSFLSRCASLFKRAVVWDDLALVDDPSVRELLSSKFVVQRWHSPAKSPLPAAARAGPWVQSHGRYLDHCSGLEYYYCCPKEDAGGLGGEACLWTELVDRHTFDSRAWPALLATSEALWTGRPGSRSSYPAFAARAWAFHRRVLGPLGITGSLGVAGEQLRRIAAASGAQLAEGPALECCLLLLGAFEATWAGFGRGDLASRRRTVDWTTARPLQMVADAVPPCSDASDICERTGQVLGSLDAGAVRGACAVLAEVFGASAVLFVALVDALDESAPLPSRRASLEALRAEAAENGVRVACVLRERLAGQAVAGPAARKRAAAAQGAVPLHASIEWAQSSQDPKLSQWLAQRTLAR